MRQKSSWAVYTTEEVDPESSTDRKKKKIDDATCRNWNVEIKV